MISSTNFHIKLDQDMAYYHVTYICICTALSVLWDVYFVKRMLYFIKLYREKIEEAKTDILGNSSQLAVQYKVDIVKYMFLLTINVTEMSGMVMYGLGSHFLTRRNTSNRTISNCTIGNTFNIELHDLIGNPMAKVYISLAQAEFLISIALVICLMKYLDVAYHNINVKPFRFIKSFLLISSLIGVVLIVTGSVPQLFILHEFCEPIIEFVYLCVWIRQTRTFYRTLKWRSVEFRVRGRSIQMVRRSIKNYQQFAFIMGLLGIGIVCMILTEFLQTYFFLFLTLVRYGPCLFHLLYNTPFYQPIFNTQLQLEALNTFNPIFSRIETILSIISPIFIGLQYVLVTIIFFGERLLRKLNYRFGRVRTRFTPNLTNPLLINSH